MTKPIKHRVLDAAEQANGHVHAAGHQAHTEAADHLGQGATALALSLLHDVVAAHRGDDSSPEADAAREAAAQHFIASGGKLLVGLTLRLVGNAVGSMIDAARNQGSEQAAETTETAAIPQLPAPGQDEQ